MVVRRWQQRAGPAVLALGVLGLFGAGGAGAEAVAWSPPACAHAPDPTALARPVTEHAAGRAWWRLEPRLDAAGSQVAQRVTLGSPSGGPARTVELAAESFAAGPFGRFILTGSDDGRTSQLRLLDLEAGCSRSIASERQVIRRATIDPGGSAIYEFRVDRRTRADLGVWRRPLDGSGPARRVLAPLAADARFGRTFSTEFSWSVEGDRLVVQSCGAFACRTRLFDPRTAATIQVDEPDLGELVGVAGDRLVTYVACRGLPCPLVSVALTDRARTTLSETAGLAVLVGDGRGAHVVHEDAASGFGHLRVVAPNGAELGLLDVYPNARLVPGPSRAQAAAGLPAGWVALAEDGRTWPDRGPVTLLRPGRAGSAAAFEEVSR